MIPGEGFNPSNEQIKAYAEQKRTEAAQNRVKEEKKKRTIKNVAALSALGVVTAAAVGMGAKAAAENRASLPDNRFTPEQSVPTAAGTEQLTPEQLQEKARIDAAEAAAEKDRVEKATAPAEIPQTIENQNPTEPNIPKSE